MQHAFMHGLFTDLSNATIQLGVHSQEFCPFGGPTPLNPPRRAMPNCTECFPGYDMSSDCSTCVGAESIQCVEGQQNCSVSVTYSV